MAAKSDLQAANDEGKPIDNIDDESETAFGEFLTTQYELLKRTLCCLPIDDLSRAARVCRSWKKTALYILKQRELRNKIRWHLQCLTPQCNRLNCYKKNITFRSQIVLGFLLAKSKNLEVMEQISYYKNSTEGRKMIIPGSRGRAFLIHSDTLTVPVAMSDNVCEYAKFRNTALFFPRSNLFTIFSTFYIDEGSLHDTIRGEIDLQYGPLQGLLMFANDHRESFNVVYNHLCHRFQRPIPLAGGLFPAVKHLESGKWHSTRGILVLGFHGSVECYSDILSDRKKAAIEPFMKKMRDNLGDSNSQTQQRIAIVIRCVSRPLAKYEDRLYQKYFPDIPAFVLVSYGEYGNPGDSTKKKDAKIFARSDVDIRYAFSSVYFIITIPLPPTTT